jgi:tRNA(Ile)-lysidine synthase
MAGLDVASNVDCALAVSGGGDSVALMWLYAGWTRHSGARPPHILIVDHRLRENSREEALRVAGWAEAEGLPATVLSPEQAPHRAANIEATARLLRYRLMGAWCRERGIGALFLAHSRDDQAETFLLRLGRGSGLDGLCGMSPVASFPLSEFPIRVCRPLLGFGRAELRDHLAQAGVPWLEDPMNADPRFARTRVRALLPLLEEAGVPIARIALAAGHLSRVRQALEARTEALLIAYVHFTPDGFALLDAAGLKAAEREIGLRALSAILMRISGARYRPRFERLERLFDALSADGFRSRTLLGCRIGRAPKARACFGPATLLIGPERPRQSRKRQTPGVARQSCPGLSTIPGFDVDLTVS